MSLDDVREGEELNHAALAAYLNEQGLTDDFPSKALSIRQFTGGYSNLTYLLSHGRQEWVLRTAPPGAVKRGHDMHREFTVQQALPSSFGKVPEMIVFCNDETVIGREFYLMKRVKGPILRGNTGYAATLSPADYGRVATVWLDTLVELHAIDYSAIGLTDLGKPDGYVERQITNWGKQYMNAATGPTRRAEQVQQWMQQHHPEQYAHGLIHNDYKYDNLVFADKNLQRVRAVLDWEMATLGDPLMDLGTSLGYWITPDDPPAIQSILGSATVFDGNPTRGELAHQYAEKTGRSLAHIVFYYVFGLFKIAVIAQQIFYRYKQGLTADPKFAHLDEAAQACLHMASGAIEKNSIDSH